MKVQVLFFCVLWSLVGCHSAKVDSIKDQTTVEEDTTLFSYEKYNNNPIKSYTKEIVGFHIIDGKASFDESFKEKYPDIFHIFYNKKMVPLDSTSELFDFSMEKMKNYSFYGTKAEEDTGICCLGVYSMYKFEFSGNNYIALYSSEFDYNYNPERSIFDPILLLYKVKKDSTFDILICSRQGDGEFKSLGDFDSNGKLDFIKSSCASIIQKINAYELNDKGIFKKTDKYLSCTYRDIDGVYIVSSQSNWYW